MSVEEIPDNCLPSDDVLAQLGFEKIPTQEHDLDGTPLPEGWPSVKEQQEHWNHKERHELLHTHLDELLADFMQHHPDEHGFTKMPIMRLIEWSAAQARSPEPTGEEKRDEKTTTAK